MKKIISILLSMTIILIAVFSTVNAIDENANNKQFK